MTGEAEIRFDAVESWGSFHSRHVAPRGYPFLEARGRKDSGLLLRVNEPGAIHVFWVLAHVCSEYGGEPGWEFETTDDAIATAWAELEPGSSLVGVWLWPEAETGVPIMEFRYSPPEPRLVEGKPRMDWREGASITVEVSGTSDNPMYGVLGNRPGLLSLAMHLATLAQFDIPVGARLQYAPGRELAGESLPLTIEKAERPSAGLVTRGSTNRMSDVK